jgi:hypothetical protein
MERARFTTRGIGPALGALGVLGALVASGCGTQSYTNHLRPAETKIVSAYISDHGVSISPAKLGAGPITIVVTNQAGTPQTLTIETAGDGAGTTRHTAQIDPTNTANLKAVVDTGTYRLKASSGDMDAAVLKVGAPRPSAQNDLAQP